jgi:TetR/AcrR family transcriptional regulator
MPPVKISQTRRSQEVRRDQSRAKILAAAEQVFARDGLVGARTDAIAAAAGVNKALLYYYFKSKASLYQAVIERHLAEFNEKALSVLTAADSPSQLLLQYLDLHFDFVSRRQRHAPLFQQVMMKRGPLPMKLFSQYIAPRTQALQQLLVRGMRSGEFRRLDPTQTAISLAALVLFYFNVAPMMQQLGYADPLSPASLSRRKKEVLNFIRHGLFTHAESRQT